MLLVQKLAQVVNEHGIAWIRICEAVNTRVILDEEYHEGLLTAARAEQPCCHGGESPCALAEQRSTA